MSEREQLSAHLSNQLEGLSRIEAPEELIRPDLGAANLEQGVPVMKMTLSLFSDLRSLELNVLPLDVLRLMSRRTQVTIDRLQQIRDFSLDHPNPTERRNGLLTQLDDDYYQHVSQLGSHLGYLLLKKTDFNTLDAAARDKMRELDDFTKNTRAEQDRIRQEMDAALLSVQAAAAKAGVAQQSIVFEKQVEEDRTRSRRWLGTVVALTVISGTAAWSLLYSWAPSADTTAQVVREVGGRFAVLALLAFVLGFTVRQYTASKHNETVNIHRQNALRTFETFVSAADDQETKDTVLLEATRAIFSPQSSGFLRSGRDPDSPSTIVEVIRRLSSSQSS